MAIEIERRFRVSSDAWRSLVERSTQITQGYLAITPESVIRVRVRGTQGYVTIKSRDGGMARQEYEYVVPLADAQSLLKLCGLRVLEKTRHEVNFAGYRWEIDEYGNPLEGLILAEVELQSETDDPLQPPWVGDEITHDGSLSNSALAARVEAMRRGHGGDIPLTGESTVSDYELYYWPVPFRGQFVRALLAFAGKRWTEHDASAISDLMGGAVKDMPAPFMGPPLLIDKATGFAIAEMPAVILYLGETLHLMPPTAPMRAQTLKIVCDANDVLDEITQQGGRDMWTDKSWQAFIPRLKKWMAFWEETGRRHGLTATAGFLLGGTAPGVADVITGTLWSTMTDRFPAIQALLAEVAPMTAALTQRISHHPALAQLAAQARADYGDAYCGGQIEASLRQVLHA